MPALRRSLGATVLAVLCLVSFTAVPTIGRMATIIRGDTGEKVPPGQMDGLHQQVPPKPAGIRENKVERGIIRELRKVDELMRNDEVDEAVVIIRNMFKNFTPTKKMKIKAFLALAHRLVDHHRYALAVKLMKWVLKPLNNHSYQCHDMEDLHQLGIFLSRYGRHTQARKAFRLVNDCTPAFGTFYDMGITYEVQHKLEMAIDYYTSATLIEPKDKGGHHALARVLHQHGQLNASLPHYRKAKKKGEDNWFESEEMKDLKRNGWPALRAAIADGRAKLLSEEPFVAEWPNYISDEEADMLIEVQTRAQKRLSQAPLECYHTVDLPRIKIDHALARVFKTSFMDLTCIDNEANAEYMNNITHSLSTFFYTGQHPALDSLVRLLGDTLEKKPEHSLLSQLLTYHSDDSYEAHCDCAVGLNRNDRATTALVYLNTLTEEQGGATRFDKLGISVQPEKGKALFFDNLLDNGLCNLDSEHTATKVAPGHVKHVFQKWFARTLLQGYHPYPSDHPMYEHTGFDRAYLNCRTVDSCRSYQFYDADTPAPVQGKVDL